MPSSPKTRTISLRVQLKERLELRHEKELKKKPIETKDDFGAYVNDLLEHVVQKDEFLKFYAPSISVIGINDNVLFLKDKDKSVEIYLKDRELYCQNDNSQNCKHIKYAFAIPEIAKLNLKSK